MIPECVFCGRPTEGESVTFFKVSGWARERKGGGVHHVRLLEKEADVVACRWCLDKEARGVAAGQMTLDEAWADTLAPAMPDVTDGIPF